MARPLDDVQRTMDARLRICTKHLTDIVRIDEEDRCTVCRLVAENEGLKAENAALQLLQGTDDHPEHKCQRCGGRNIVWHADNDVWNEIVEDRENTLCPLCLAELAEEQGVAPTAWRLSREGDDSKLDKIRTELYEAKQGGAWLREVVEAADRLAAKLGTKEHPAGGWYEEELTSLDVLLAEAQEVHGDQFSSA